MGRQEKRARSKLTTFQSPLIEGSHMQKITLPKHAAIGIFVLSLSGCASADKQSMQNKNDAAIAKCFKTYDNWPSRRLECINKIRGIEDPQDIPANKEESAPS